MEPKITKRTLLREINNEMCHNYYYLVNGKMYNDTHTKYKHFKFVVFFDIYDVYEWYEDKQAFTKADIREYLDVLIGSYLDYIKSFDDCDEFYAVCSQTIKDYNERL